MMTDSSRRKCDSEKVKVSLATKNKKRKKKLKKKSEEACVISQEGGKHKRKKKKKRSKKISEEVILQCSDDGIKDSDEAESRAVDDDGSFEISMPTNNRPFDYRHENESERAFETNSEKEREEPQLYEEGNDIVCENSIGSTDVVAFGISSSVRDDERESSQSTNGVTSVPNTEHKDTETVMNALPEDFATTSRSEEPRISSSVQLRDKLDEKSDEEESGSTTPADDRSNANIALEESTSRWQRSIQTVTHVVPKKSPDTKTEHSTEDCTLSDDVSDFPSYKKPEEPFNTKAKAGKSNQEEEDDDDYIDFDPSEVLNDHAVLDEISVLVLHVQEIQKEEWLVEKRLPRTKPKRRFKLSLKRIAKLARFLRSHKQQQKKLSTSNISNVDDTIPEEDPVSVSSKMQVPRQEEDGQSDISLRDYEVNASFSISKHISVQPIVCDMETALECSIDDGNEAEKYNSLIVYENTHDAREASRSHDKIQVDGSFAVANIPGEEKEESEQIKIDSSTFVLDDSGTILMEVGNEIRLCNKEVLVLDEEEHQTEYCRFEMNVAIEDTRGRNKSIEFVDQSKELDALSALDNVSVLVSHVQEIQQDFFPLPASIVVGREERIEQVLLPEKKKATREKQHGFLNVPLKKMAKLLSLARLKKVIETETYFPARRIKPKVETTDYEHLIDSKNPLEFFPREEASFGFNISDCVGIETFLLSDEFTSKSQTALVKGEHASLILKLLNGGSMENALRLLHNKFASESKTLHTSTLMRQQPFEMARVSTLGDMEIELCLSEDEAEIELCLLEDKFGSTLRKAEAVTLVNSLEIMEQPDKSLLSLDSEGIEIEFCQQNDEYAVLSQTAHSATTFATPLSEMELLLSETVRKGKRWQIEMPSKCHRRIPSYTAPSSPSIETPESSEQPAMLESADDRKSKLHLGVPSKKRRIIEKDRVNEPICFESDGIELCLGAKAIELCLSESKLASTLSEANSTSVLGFSTAREQPDVLPWPLDGGAVTEIELCLPSDKFRVISNPAFREQHVIRRPANREKTWTFFKYLQNDQREKETIVETIFSIVEDIELCIRPENSTPKSQKERTKLPKTKDKKCETLVPKCEPPFSLEGNAPIADVVDDSKDAGDIKAVELCLLTDDFASDSRNETVRLLVTNFERADFLQNEDERRKLEAVEPKIKVVLSDIGISREVELCLCQDEFVPISRPMQPMPLFEASVLREITNTLDTKVLREESSLSSLSSSYDGSDLSSSSESSFGSSFGPSIEEKAPGGDHGLYHALNTFSEIMSIPSPLSNPEDDWTNYSEIQSATKPPKVLECKVYNTDTGITSKRLTKNIEGGDEGIESKLMVQTIRKLASSLKDREAQIKSQDQEIESLKEQLRAAQLERSHFEKKALEIEQLLINHEKTILKLSDQVSAL